MKKLWLVFLSVLVAILALTACSTEVNDGKIDGIDKLPAKVEVTGLEGVTGTVEAKPLDEKALADAFAAVREVYYVAEGADYLAADIYITNDGEPVTLGKPVTVSITVPDTFALSLDNCVVFHIHDGTAEQIIPTVSDGKLTFTVDSFSPFVIVPLHEHVYGEWTTYRETTCAEGKIEIRRCVCGARQTREVGEPLGHIDANGDNVCDRCGLGGLDGEGEHTHAFGEWTFIGDEPGCGEAGIQKRTCVCGEEQTRDYTVDHVDENEDGKCDRCGLGGLDGEGEHTHAFGEWTFIGDEPGCGEAGIQKRTCVCGEEQTRDYTVDHVDENGDGKCDRCGISLDGTHTHEFGEWQPLNGSLPTCTESAWEIRKCSCGETERREVPALGHIDENGDGKCDRCGISLDGTHTHEFGEWQPLNGSLPTCTESAWEIRKCSCGETERREVPALGHIDENGDDYCDRCREYLGGNEPAVTNDAYTREGDYIYFGSYPQTVVTDDRVKIGLTALAGDLPTAEDSKNWTSYGYYIEGEVVDYMWYIDLAYNEVKYRGVYFTSYRPDETHRLSKAANSQQDDNGYNVSTVYWFKYEPIKWRILSEANGEALILCEMIIDSREYCNFDEETQQRVEYSHNGGNGYANNYALSDIRAWLNDTFYNTAFSALQKEYIKLTTVKNDLTSANPNSDPTFETRDKYVSFLCEDTEDHIFLLSFQEATNDAYGYNPDMENVADAAREKIPTDYAKSQGVKVSKDTGYVGNGAYWWLRTPAEYAAYSSRGVLYNGAAGGGIGVSNVHVGVVPALVINLGAEE